MKFLPNKIIYILIYSVVAVFILLSAYNFYFLNRILHGVYINNTNFGGLTYKEASKKMDSIIPSTKQVKIKMGNNEFFIDFNSINLTYSKENTFNNLFKVGRQGILTHYLHLVGFVKPVKSVDLDYSFDEVSLDVELATLSAQIFPKVKNAYFSYQEDKLIINEAGEGQIIDLQGLRQDIVSNLKTGKVEYSAKLSNFVPSVYKKDLEAKVPFIEKLVKDGVLLKYKDEDFKPEKEQIIKFVNFEKKLNTVTAVVNKTQVENYIEFVAGKINRDAKSIDFKIVDGNLESFKEPETGRELEKNVAVKDLENALNEYFKSNNIKEISLSVKEVSPSTKSNEYGITELVAEGVSYFEHSIPSRVSNIVTAGKKINGTLVAPGEFYSFNESVGPITAETGFNSAYVISKGRTILGTGGGVCQVSSTVFRAALNGGFPITERTAHAYRVSYYEQKSKIGYDATIYQPSVDLKFKNDTEHYLLVTSEVDAEKYRMFVRIYGTKDGRTVEVTDPVLGPQLAPPATIYEDDPSLPKGQLVQIEYPAWGGSSVFKQIVKNKDGSLRHQNEFKSYYRPWAAVFKKGTKD